MAKKVDFRKFLDPIQDLVLKRVSHFGIPFGTKNHKMRGPPLLSVALLDIAHRGTYL